MATDAQISPREHDEAQAQRYEDYAKAERNLTSHIDRMHRMAGDRRDYHGRQQVWRMTHAQVLDQLRSLVAMGDERNLSHGMTPSEAMTREELLRTEVAKVMVEIEASEVVYREHRWTRYFPCMNADGHIHSSLHGCPTVRYSTMMGWTPQLSGKPVEDAVAELGEALCSVCYPDAPVAWKSKTLGQLDRERRAAEREAAKAEKQRKADERAARAAERASQPKKATAKDRRYQALNALGEKYRTEGSLEAAGREQIATDIEKLAELGKTEAWQSAISFWAAAVRDQENGLAWAYCQYGVLAGHAA